MGNAEWITNNEIAKGKKKSGETVTLKRGDKARLIRPMNCAHTEWLAMVLEAEDFDIVEYLNS